MGFISYLREGVNIANQEHRRCNPIYQKDQAQVIGRATYQYDGKITSQEKNDRVYKCILDGTVEVLTVTNEVRSRQLDFWKQYKVYSLNFGISGLVLAAAGTISGIATKTLLVGSLVVPTPVIGAAIAVVGVAFAILGFHRRKQAHKQYLAWQDPLPAYQAQRRQAGEIGFSHVFSHQLKGTLIHPNECHQLWEIWSQHTMSSYQGISVSHRYSPEVVPSIKKFFNSNPLDSQAIAYAFNNVKPVPQHIQDLSQFYQDVKRSYSDVRAKATSIKEEIRSEEAQLINKNEIERAVWLAPAQFVRDLWKQKAKDRQLEKIRLYHNAYQQQLYHIGHRRISSQEKREAENKAYHDYNQQPAVQEANREYDLECNRYDILYNIAVTPIHNKFNHNRGRIKNWADWQVRRINQQEDQQISDFAQDVREIAQAYRNVSVYNRSQEQMSRQERLYPDLNFVKSFTNLNEAYSQPQPAPQPAAYSYEELNLFYHEIHQYKPKPSAPPYEQQF
jgi:hypothetical protein